MKPIIFSTNMINAILENRKSATRRVVKNQFNNKGDIAALSRDRSDRLFFVGRANAKKELINPYLQYKYSIGDILWVRETWSEIKNADGSHMKYVYKADGAPSVPGKYIVKFRWRPSIFMPREATRLFLRVENVRVERLQDITEEDAMAEGARPMANPGMPDAGASYRLGYSVLWDSLNAKRGYGWDINPWLWVYEFSRIALTGE